MRSLIELPDIESGPARSATGSFESLASGGQLAFLEALHFRQAAWRPALRLVFLQFAAGLLLVAAILSDANRPGRVTTLSSVAIGLVFFAVGSDLRRLAYPPPRSWPRSRRVCREIETAAFFVCAILALFWVVTPADELQSAVTAVALLGMVFSVVEYGSADFAGWRAAVVIPRFAGATLLLGATGGALWAGWCEPVLAPTLAAIATFIRTVLFGWERLSMRRALRHPASPNRSGVALVVRILGSILRMRGILFVLSTLFSVMAMTNLAQAGRFWGAIACATTVSSQLLERYLFFASANPEEVDPGCAMEPILRK